jgi:hypothetical protein
MNILAKLATANILGAVVIGAVTFSYQAKTPMTAGLPEIATLTAEAGARIAQELNAQLTAAASLAKPVRGVREPSVIISEGSDIVSEEVIVLAKRFPKLDSLVSAADTTATPVRF